MSSTPSDQRQNVKNEHTPPVISTADLAKAFESRMSPLVDFPQDVDMPPLEEAEPIPMAQIVCEAEQDSLDGMPPPNSTFQERLEKLVEESEQFRVSINELKAHQVTQELRAFHVKHFTAVLRRNPEFQQLFRDHRAIQRLANQTREMLNDLSVKMHALSALSDTSFMNLKESVASLGTAFTALLQLHEASSSLSNRLTATTVTNWEITFGPARGTNEIERALDAVKDAGIRLSQVKSVVATGIPKYVYITFCSKAWAKEFIRNVRINHLGKFVDENATLSPNPRNPNTSLSN